MLKNLVDKDISCVCGGDLNRCPKWELAWSGVGCLAAAPFIGIAVAMIAYHKVPAPNGYEVGYTYHLTGFTNSKPWAAFLGLCASSLPAVVGAALSVVGYMETCSIDY